MKSDNRVRSNISKLSSSSLYPHFSSRDQRWVLTITLIQIQQAFFAIASTLGSLERLSALALRPVRPGASMQRMRIRRNFGCAAMCIQFQKQGFKVAGNFGEADREEEKDRAEKESQIRVRRAKGLESQMIKEDGGASLSLITLLISHSHIPHLHNLVPAPFASTATPAPTKPVFKLHPPTHSITLSH